MQQKANIFYKLLWFAFSCIAICSDPSCLRTLQMVCSLSHCLQLRLIRHGRSLAPLAFVSGLAGTLLALKLMECHVGCDTYSYWRVSPWANPNYRMLRNYSTSEKREF